MSLNICEYVCWSFGFPLLWISCLYPLAISFYIDIFKLNSGLFHNSSYQSIVSHTYNNQKKLGVPGWLRQLGIWLLIPDLSDLDVRVMSSGPTLGSMLTMEPTENKTKQNPRNLPVLLFLFKLAFHLINLFLEVMIICFYILFKRFNILSYTGIFSLSTVYSVL